MAWWKASDLALVLLMGGTVGCGNGSSGTWTSVMPMDQEASEGAVPISALGTGFEGTLVVEPAETGCALTFTIVGYSPTVFRAVDENCTGEGAAATFAHPECDDGNASGCGLTLVGIRDLSIALVAAEPPTMSAALAPPDNAWRQICVGEAVLEE